MKAISLITVAMDHEAQALLPLIKIKQKLAASPGKLFLGTLAGHDVAVLRTGLSETTATTSIKAALPQLGPIKEVIITGYAGALTEQFALGDAILATELKQSSPDAIALVMDATLQQKAKQVLESAQINYQIGNLLTVEQPLVNHQQKSAAGIKYQCEAVEMETYASAMLLKDVAPILAIRFIMDTVNCSLENLPDVLHADGTVSPLKLLKATLREPKMLIELPRLGKMAKLAQRNLSSWIKEYFSV